MSSSAVHLPHPCVSLRGQHVLITGGSSGIGLALARHAVIAGARVSLVARDPAKLARAKDHLREIAATAHVGTFPADVASPTELTGALTAAEAELGPVDVLITSAGVACADYFEAIPADAFERTMAVNYLGTVRAVRAVTAGMRQRGRGAIVLISSGAAFHGFFGYTAYAPTKFALRGFAEALRAELCDSGVHVMIVYPPDTDTPQLAEENRTKPAETRAVTSGGGLWRADAVARVTLAGLHRRRFAITPGIGVTALAWLHSLAAPLFRWHFERVARNARH